MDAHQPNKGAFGPLTKSFEIYLIFSLVYLILVVLKYISLTQKQASYWLKWYLRKIVDQY